MFILKRLNVVKVADSKEKRDKLIAKGFELVTDQEETGKKNKKEGDKKVTET